MVNRLADVAQSPIEGMGKGVDGGRLLVSGNDQTGAAMPLQIALGFVVLGLTLSAAMVVFTDTLSALYGDLLAGG